MTYVAKIKLVVAILIAVSAFAECAPDASAVPPPVDALPSEQPAWLAPFRLRYTLHFGGVRKKATFQSLIAQLPTGGRLRPDAADIAVVASDGERLPIRVLSHDPQGTTLIQFPRRGENTWYYAFAVAGNAAIPPAPKMPDAKDDNAPIAQEGLTVEVRRWAGDNLDSWAAVRDGLTESKTVIGNGVTTEIIENCNPARPNDPRNYASSYRGYLNIKEDGVYRFFVNAEDAAFLFIDGFKVTERTGTNNRMTGYVKVRDMGEDVELKAGVHPFEVHHVMGNNPTAIGYCALMWVPPGAKTWNYVPYTAIAPADVARVAAIDEVQNRPAAQYVYGIDDTLRSGDGSLVYLVRFEAVGPLGNDPSGDGSSLHWDFADGTTGRGRSVTHVYFQAGDYEVALKSGDLPPYRQNVHVWPVPGNTSPLSLGTAVASLKASEWQKYDVERLNRMFQFLVVCEQDNRWPLVDAVAEKLLTAPSLDLKQKLFIQRTRMESLAYQGRADEAIALGEKVLAEFGRVPSLQVGARLELANIYHRHLKKFDEAAARYEAIVTESRRVEHPDVRVAAIRWGDLYAETGDLRRAGECYRQANALGGEDFRSSSLTGAVTRGGLLRTAEQKLRAGDIQQTRQLLERIELHYPEEKLEGLYRALRADADRRTGRYEEALRNYEILLKLTQWSGFHDRAMHGMADTYFRLGDFAKALEWLDTLEKSYERYFTKEKLADYRKLLIERRDRIAAAQTSGDAKGTPLPASGFVDVVETFDPAGIAAIGELPGMSLAPGLGIAGPHVALGCNIPGYVGYFDCKRPIPSLTGGEFWVEMWYRDTQMPLTGLAPHMHVSLYDEAFTKFGFYTGTARIDRTYGVWRRIGYLLQTPPHTQKGSLTFTMRTMLGIAEIDGLEIRAVSDRQSDALNNFLKGSDVE